MTVDQQYSHMTAAGQAFFLKAPRQYGNVTHRSRSL